MNPQNDQLNGQVGRPQTDHAASSPSANQVASQQAAADIVRGQLDAIYGGQSGEDTPHTTPVVTDHSPELNQEPTANHQATETSTEPQATEPSISHGFRTAPPETNQKPDTEQLNYTPAESIYRRTMSTELRPAASQNQWKEYHSAWQKYYQLYYERQYLNSVYAQQQAEKLTSNEGAKTPVIASGADENTVSQEAAMRELRESIRKKVADSAEKVTKSRHFIPAIAGVAVLVVFMFLQYNRVIFGAVAAYVSPGNIEPQNIITDPTVNVDVGPEPKMIIPKINIDAPVVYGIGPDHNSQMKAMENGIAHFSIPGANAVPGQVGNAVFAAHSSNDVFASGDYKFVFAQNEKLAKGDIIYMNYEGKRYTYSITNTEVVMPNEVSKVQIQTDKPMLTLVSCVPLGTAEKRLLVYAEQVSPDPAKAEQATSSSTAPEAQSIPGKPAPTLIERIFGAN